MAKVNLSVSVKDEHMPKFTEIVKELKKTGFNVDQELASAGVVTGSIDDQKVHDLKKLTGVEHVEESRGIQIPSPESEIQ
jgi:PHP family Zn ribbon phosphoesterase